MTAMLPLLGTIGLTLFLRQIVITKCASTHVVVVKNFDDWRKFGQKRNLKQIVLASRNKELNLIEYKHVDRDMEPQQFERMLQRDNQMLDLRHDQRALFYFDRVNFWCFVPTKWHHSTYFGHKLTTEIIENSF